MTAHRVTRQGECADAEQFDAACAALMGSVMPYVAACYGRIYPEQKRLVDARKAAAPLAAAIAADAAAVQGGGAARSSGGSAARLVSAPA